MTDTRIYLAGKAFFSSRGLLPADPSAFTLPSHTLPSASSFTVAEPAPNAELSEEPVETTSQPTKARKTIKTGYTLETFQTPSPDWVWMTPWMINMRTGTDEGGWRYNYWFRSNGWKTSPGSAGWGGWVRRREWVRLRTLAADDEVLEPPAEPEKVDPGEELHVLMGEGGVDKVVKALSKEPLDRTRLETWERWLEKGHDADKRKLQTALDDDETVSCPLGMRQHVELTFRYTPFPRRSRISRLSRRYSLYLLRMISPSPRKPTRHLHRLFTRLRPEHQDSTRRPTILILTTIPPTISARKSITSLILKPATISILRPSRSLPRLRSLLSEIHPQLLQCAITMTDFVLLRPVHLGISLALGFGRFEYCVPTEMSRSAWLNDSSFRLAFKEDRFLTRSGRVGESAQRSRGGRRETREECVQACL